MLPVEEKWSPGLAELMFLGSTPELKGNLIPIIAAPLRRSSVTESVALPPNTGNATHAHRAPALFALHVAHDVWRALARAVTIRLMGQVNSNGE
jgi:hypothetical protein